MRTAQSLYEQGYITYMRTDSVHLSAEAISAARNCVEKLYGKTYLSPAPRQYTTKSKGAQEAHEAIRPAGNTFRTPQETGLSGREFALYDLIWKRTVASQMADARQTQISVQVQVEDAGFRSSGKRIDFPGFLRAYVEGSDDPNAALEDQEVILPPLKVGDFPECKALDAISHETQPPARYTEASLVKTLESEGIGRPSTYASIIGTIIDRGYAQLTNNALVPTFTAFAVTALLEEHFPDFVNTSFTSKMEQTLDDIAAGEVKWLPYLRQFYSGDKGLETLVKERESQIDPIKARTVQLEDLDVKVRIGKFGPYVEADNGNGTVTASIPPNLNPADINSTQVGALLQGPNKVGSHPDTGETIYLKIGSNGYYLQLGEPSEQNKKPKTASLPAGVSPEAVTLAMAVNQLSLPRTLGVHPVTNGKIQAGLGKFGPFIVHNQSKDEKDYRSLKGADDVFTISLERAIEILSEPKKTGRSKSKQALKELGSHPADNEPVNIYDGPYGAYIKHGKVNVGLAEGQTVETITLATALELLATKKPASSAKRTTKAKSTTTTAKKTTASRSRAKSSSKT